MRIRREFTDDFKRAAIQRLGTVSVAEVARDCGVSVSVLHRWRKQLVDRSRSVDVEAVGVEDATEAESRGRRRFSKEFKQSIVQRMEAGESVGDIVRVFEINPTVVRRWWHEWCKYDAAAFSGYGKSRSPAPSTRTVIVRFTADEYEGIKAASVARRASSLPDFVRGQLLPSRGTPSLSEIARRLDALIASVQRAAQHRFKLAEQPRGRTGATPELLCR